MKRVGRGTRYAGCGTSVPRLFVAARCFLARDLRAHTGNLTRLSSSSTTTTTHHNISTDRLSPSQLHRAFDHAEPSVPNSSAETSRRPGAPTASPRPTRAAFVCRLSSPSQPARRAHHRHISCRHNIHRLPPEPSCTIRGGICPLVATAAAFTATAPVRHATAGNSV
jgi:hypothetical protein